MSCTGNLDGGTVERTTCSIDLENMKEQREFAGSFSWTSGAGQPAHQKGDFDVEDLQSRLHERRPSAIGGQDMGAVDDTEGRVPKVQFADRLASPADGGNVDMEGFGSDEEQETTEEPAPGKDPEIACEFVVRQRKPGSLSAISEALEQPSSIGRTVSLSPGGLVTEVEDSRGILDCDGKLTKLHEDLSRNTEALSLLAALERASSGQVEGPANLNCCRDFEARVGSARALRSAGHMPSSEHRAGPEHQQQLGQGPGAPRQEGPGPPRQELVT